MQIKCSKLSAYWNTCPYLFSCSCGVSSSFLHVAYSCYLYLVVDLIFLVLASTSSMLLVGGEYHLFFSFGNLSLGIIWKWIPWLWFFTCSIYGGCWYLLVYLFVRLGEPIFFGSIGWCILHHSVGKGSNTPLHIPMVYGSFDF